MRRTFLQGAAANDAIVARLQNELYEARLTIIDLMPPNIRDLLTTYHSCETSKETYAWDDKVAEALIEMAEPLPNPAPNYLPNRAYCPLCQRGSSSPYTDGFTLPEGLRRHLIGQGNVQQCDVTAATMGLARESWHSRFAAVDAAEATREQARKEQRKSTEVLYCMGPKEEPELLDESLGYGRAPRDSAELTWAEQRLSSLGFQTVIEGRTKSYINTGKDFVVYADPRTKGEITFRVYWNPPQKKRFAARYAYFSFKDTWKHDLMTKYKARIATALSSRPA